MLKSTPTIMSGRLRLISNSWKLADLYGVDPRHAVRKTTTTITTLGRRRHKRPMGVSERLGSLIYRRILDCYHIEAGNQRVAAGRRRDTIG